MNTINTFTKNLNFNNIRFL